MDTTMVVAEVATRFGVPVGAIYALNRTWEVAQARHAAAWALAQIGLSNSAIGRALGRDHSTVLNSLRRAAEHAEWQERARPATFYFGTAGAGLALASWLDRLLPGDTSPDEHRAVYAYAACTLLGWERYLSPLCSHGLLLVATKPAVRSALEEALRRIEADVHIQRIEAHTARFVRAG